MTVNGTVYPRKERGVALLTVMFIMMLLTTLVVYLVEDDQMSIRRVANHQDSEQGYHIAVYAEQWTRELLEADMRDNNVDHDAEPWKTEAPEWQDDERRAALSTGVVDLQGRFNLNNLAVGRDEVWYPAFQRLLAVLELDVGLADTVVDWVDADINVGGHDGAEDAEYQLEDPAYRAANRLMTDISELAWIRGMTSEAIQALTPHVTALPVTGVRINVNTASSTLLRALTPNILDEGAAEALIAGRGEDGYGTVAEFLTMGAVAGSGDALEPLISVNSEYFEVTSDVDIGRYGTVLYSVIHRTMDTKQTKVIQRRRGVS